MDWPHCRGDCRSFFDLVDAAVVCSVMFVHRKIWVGNRRIGILMVKFWRSTKDILACAGSGSPLTVFMSQAQTETLPSYMLKDQNGHLIYILALKAERYLGEAQDTGRHSVAYFSCRLARR
jgi:hypothetical protein